MVTSPKRPTGDVMDTRPLYPFTAVVGQERLKLALLLVVVNPVLGGLLIRGGTGTAKSTTVRALTALLPQIEVVRGCAYACDPTAADPCRDCTARRALGPLLERTRRRIPMVELPLGATADRVLGSLDRERTLSTGEPQFEPGLLAQANRGILYIDEVNLLDAYLGDLLLDPLAMGYNYVERDGFSFSHPARFMLVGTMNPEEGELRPQLLDRFALAVELDRLQDPAQRSELVLRRMAFEADPERFLSAWAPAEERERERLERARTLLPSVEMPDPMLNLIVRACAAAHVDGVRGDLAMYRAAIAHAAYQGRREVTGDDVGAAAELALPHRLQRQPAEHAALDQERVRELLESAKRQGPAVAA